MSPICYIYFNEKNWGYGGLENTERGGGLCQKQLETIDL
jgi:hypothetical protein